MVAGGFLVGFGTAWAGGCTSGHGVTGLADLQLPSLIAVIGEMFRFGSFYMYGVLFSAIAVARLSLMLLRRKAARAITGEPIALAPKTLGHGTRYWGGGIVFGVGWALTGACPGPLVALVGSGATVYLVALASAIAGAWAYGWARPYLPH